MQCSGGVVVDGGGCDRTSCWPSNKSFCNWQLDFGNIPQMQFESNL